MKNFDKKNKEVALFLIEDDDIDALTIERGLKQQNIDNPIIRAYDGQQAIELLEEHQVPSPYVIVLDLQMPRLNGVEFLKKIRSEDKYKDAVVFVLTTSVSDSDVMETYSQHVAGYFVKDQLGDNFSELINMLSKYWKIVVLPSK